MSVRYFLLRTQILLAVCFVISGGQIDPCVSRVTLQTALDLTKESLVNIRRVYRQCDKKDNPPSCYQEKTPRVKAYIAVALDLIKTVKRKHVACTTTPSLSSEQLNELRATTETIEALLSRTTSSPDIKHPDQTSETNSEVINLSTTLSTDTTNQFGNMSSATNVVEISLSTTLSPDTTNQIGYIKSGTNLDDNSSDTTTPSPSTEQPNQLRATTETIEVLLSTTSSPDIKKIDQTSETNSAKVNLSTTLSPDTTNQFNNTSSATNFVEISLSTTLSPDTTNQIDYMPSGTNLDDNSSDTNSPGLTTRHLNQVPINNNSIENSITDSSTQLKNEEAIADKINQRQSELKDSSSIASVDAGNPYNELNNSLSPSTYDNSTIHPNFSLPMDCLEILQNGQNTSGVYKIQLRMPEAEKKTLDVYCDMDTDGGGWTAIQKRAAHGVQQKFSKDWTSYKYGFGNIEVDFWLGNENIYFLTNQVQDQAIRFDLEDLRGNKKHATYSRFRIDNEKNSYKLQISGYSGDAGDSMSNQNGWEFSTDDNSTGECAKMQRGGWWFGSCTALHLNGLTANLNGIYYPGITQRYQCTFWFHWLKYECLKVTEMKLRRI